MQANVRSGKDVNKRRTKSGLFKLLDSSSLLKLSISTSETLERERIIKMMSVCVRLSLFIFFLLNARTEVILALCIVEFVRSC